MNNIIFILYLILLVNHVRGSSDVEVMHDIADLRDKFDHILGHALLNKNGSDIVKIGRGTYCSWCLTNEVVVTFLLILSY
jgi:hypothetical protein